SFLFSSPRPSQISPLFPYTTLFRSGRARDPDRCAPRPLLGRHDRPLDESERWVEQREVPHDPFGPRRGVELALAHLALVQMPLGDRKSTRLNSSHDQISYAVFCLKK